VAKQAITWLDFRAEDLARARGFIKLLQDESVIDELGFLALQARFSDIFYPATSTPMSRPRYLYFVAGIYRQLEREGTRSNQVAGFARKGQDALRSALVASEHTGVIGREAQMEVKQLPSLVYWSALRKLGMFTASMFEATYQSVFDELRLQRRGYADDDKTVQASIVATYWDSDLPPSRFLDHDGNVRPGTTFALSKAEAEDLSRRFNERFGNCLLVHLLRHGLPNTDHPWNCPKPTDYLKPYLKLGQALSLFARGVTLQYYQQVLEARAAEKFDANTEIVGPAFAKWWAEARPILNGWRADDFRTFPTIATALRPGRIGDIGFINGWLERMDACRTADALLADGKARDLIEGREIAVKPLKARLKHLKHLKQWNISKVDDMPYQFEYRHSVGMRFVADILDGLERGQ